jgi:hypothetical protein
MNIVGEKHKNKKFGLGESRLSQIQLLSKMTGSSPYALSLACHW